MKYKNLLTFLLQTLTLSAQIRVRSTQKIVNSHIKPEKESWYGEGKREPPELYLSSKPDSRPKLIDDGPRLEMSHFAHCVSSPSTVFSRPEQILFDKRSLRTE